MGSPRAVRARSPAAVPADGDRQQQILAAALDLFARRSLATVTIKDIGAACGINPALIYYYFASKEDLFAKAMGHLTAELIATYEALKARAAEPLRLIDAWLDVHRQKPQAMRALIRMMMDDSGTTEALAPARAEVQRFYRFERTLIAEALKAGVEQGLLRPLDPRQMARFCSLQLDGIVAHSFTEDAPTIDSGIENFREVLWSLLLRDDPDSPNHSD
ncbi:TetR/AcrR family transcriptional regulator [Zavarzinia sp. CC-PAN008]|uniref:TetR/AcrR family transcriptional regulator n=1 Tax=Zavarzinia sp. CC-PAN008 TaxID=3243332 RepID=UPI003F748CC7